MQEGLEGGFTMSSKKENFSGYQFMVLGKGCVDALVSLVVGFVDWLGPICGK